MKTRDLLIRCLAFRESGQWVGICLPFDLAVQGDNPEEVKAKLREQIRAYLQDALNGQDREHAEHLLRRRAPAKYWAMYWAIKLASHLRKFIDARTYQVPMPMVPANC